MSSRDTGGNIAFFCRVIVVRCRFWEVDFLCQLYHPLAVEMAAVEMVAVEMVAVEMVAVIVEMVALSVVMAIIKTIFVLCWNNVDFISKKFGEMALTTWPNMV